MGSFTKDYPEDSDLSALVEAFEAGNYRAVRDGAKRIATNGEKSESVKVAAADLRSRTEPARLQLLLLGITALLAIALSTYEIVTHGRDAPRPAPPRTIERVH